MRGGDTIDVKFEAPNNAEVVPQIVDNKNGTYQVSFTPPAEGHYKVSVYIKGSHVTNSPFMVYVGASVDFSKLGKAIKKFGVNGINCV